jgi:uncharacterized membrane protein YbhN (UPF0104 family)
MSAGGRVRIASAEAGASESPKRHVRLGRIAVGALALVVAGALAELLGWDIASWFRQLWDTISAISPVYVVGAVTAGFVQTTATAFGWWSILRFGFPDADVPWRQIWAAYAASVALNGILPANFGTFVMLVMFTILIAAATFAAVLGAYAVQKIFYCVFGAIPYAYLFFTVAGSFDIKFEFVRDHPWATATVFVGGGLLIALLVRAFWPRVVRWWAEAKEGGAILGRPRAYFTGVFVPGVISWIAMLVVIGMFLAAYDIPATFDTLMRVVAGNSIANVTSVTPGGAGVTQAFNVASLKGITTSANATAFSVSQQLVMTTWNILVAIVLVTWAFGWTEGRSLVEKSYLQAKEQAASRDRAKERGEQGPADPLGRPASRAAADADQLRELRRAGQRLLAHDPDARRVDLLVVRSRFQPRRFERRQRILELPAGNAHRAAALDDPRGVLCLATRELLPVAVRYLRVRLHHEARLGVVHAGLPGAGGVDLPVRQIGLCVLAEVPDVAAVVLGVPVGRVLELRAVVGRDVPDDARRDAFRDELRLVGDRDRVHLCLPVLGPAVDPRPADREREVRVVDGGREVGGIKGRLVRGAAPVPRHRAPSPGCRDRERQCDRRHGDGDQRPAHLFLLARNRREHECPL